MCEPRNSLQISQVAVLRLPVSPITPLDSFGFRLILLSSLGSTKFIFNFVIPFLTPWREDILYSAAYTFINIWRAILATKLLSTSSYKLGFHRYGWGSRTFRNITTDSIYILIQGWLSMTQLLLEHSWRSHYSYNHQRTVSLFKRGLYFLFSSAQLTFKVKEIQTTLAGFWNISFLT